MGSLNLGRPPAVGGLLVALGLFLLSSTFSPGVRVVNCDQDLYEEETEPFFKTTPLDNSPKSVTFDGRSLMVNGTRQVFVCGSVHYTRLQPEYWDDVLKKSRMGGLNCIQSYVFWNAHEPVKGQFNFTGINDLVLFIKKVAENGMYFVLRIGPFIQGEWNHGGLPYWLRDEKNIIFRTDNPAYKRAMEKWTVKVIDMMKENRFFAPQGGPIIMAQIENEYDHVAEAYDKYARSYILWAAQMAKDQNIGVPWLMCKQKDAPFDIINTCNGRQCGETFFPGPNAPNKPMMWTENWTAQYRVFGDPPSKRGAEDIAYSVARWFSKNGTHLGYYMYFGGTNFGRTAAAFVTTRYYDEAPLDEYGLIREPKYGHLRDLHYTLELCKPGLWGEYKVENPSASTDIRWYEDPVAKTCVAFLWNNNTHQALNIKFKGKNFLMPPKSISILPDCKTLVYNTNTVLSQHNSRNFTKSDIVHKNIKWEMTTESVPELGGKFSPKPLEQYYFTKDTTDYMWYMTSIEMDAYDLPFRRSIQPVLDILSLGHGIIVYVNGKYVGAEHGTKKQSKFSYTKPVLLHEGVNHFAFLQTTIGMPDSGSYLEHRYAGLRTLVIQGLGTGNLDLTKNGWHHKAGLEGERLQYFTEEGSKKAKWGPIKPKPTPLTWYKARFDAPEGDGALAIRMDNMTKGMVWVNGNNIGRYWTSFVSPLNTPSQNEYHIPRSFIKPKDNLIVIFDELGGLIEEVDISVVDRDVICSWISEKYPSHVSSWKWENDVLVSKPETVPKSMLQCPTNKVVKKVDYASFGDPWGTCGLFKETTCHAKKSQEIVEKACLGKKMCKIPVDRKLFDDGVDPCPEVKEKILAVQLRCGPKE